jgi:2-polyprenyl-6-methoxyphenol hydroxylase-like FAD-dependent oxidoreductase
MRHEYDVAIVGGGVAGSALGIALAREGLRVAIAERQAEFDDRVRGEWLAPWGAAEARKLQLRPAFEAAGVHELPWNISRSGRPRRLETPEGDVPLSFWHPELQDSLLSTARDEGVNVWRPVTVTQIRGGARPGFTVNRDGLSCEISARLVVGAEGRASQVRRMLGRSEFEHRSQRLLAGVRVSGLGGDPSQAYYLIRPNAEGLAMVYPQGGGFGRVYTFLPDAAPSDFAGEEGFRYAIDLVVEAGVPAEVVRDAKQEGPLAAFEASDSWIRTPYRDGLAVVGDAAGVTDPTWGMGISLALKDAATLARTVRESGDPQFAAARYAREHDRYFDVVRTIENWQSDLLFTPGAEADERRRAAARLWSQEPSRVLDLNGLGPAVSVTPEARVRFFGEDVAPAAPSIARAVGA